MDYTIDYVWNAIKGYAGSAMTGIFAILTLQDIMYSVGILVSIVFTVKTYISNKKRNERIEANAERRTKIINMYLSSKIRTYETPEESINDVTNVLDRCDRLGQVDDEK